ncbi:MAG: hypothetical protein AAF322_05860 [Pseudomonadota bacterium]
MKNGDAVSFDQWVRSLDDEVLTTVAIRGGATAAETARSIAAEQAPGSTAPRARRAPARIAIPGLRRGDARVTRRDAFGGFAYS